MPSDAEDVSSGAARTEKEIADMVRAAHERKRAERQVREEAERVDGVLPERSYSPDPPTRHEFPYTPEPTPTVQYSVPSDEFIVKTPAVTVPVVLPAKYAFLNADLKGIVDNFTNSATMAEGDREWLAQLATEFLIRARELCVKMIG